MNIEIHQPRLEALIQQRMASGHFQSIEDLLLQTLETSPDVQGESASKAPKQNLDEFLMASPLGDSGLVLEREKRNLAELFEPIRGLLTDEEVDTLFRRDPSPGRTINLS